MAQEVCNIENFLEGEGEEWKCSFLKKLVGYFCPTFPPNKFSISVRFIALVSLFPIYFLAICIHG